ncbi:MAG TPA: hypothetical protein V6C76_15615 [Drouetiella sp.]
MKAGLHVGHSEEIDILVTKDMRAEFLLETVGDLYSTSSLVNHIETAARRVLKPFLEDNEQGMVSHLDISHLTLTVAGMYVKVKATVSEIRDTKIVCDVEASNTRGKVARGVVTITVADKTWLENKIKEMSIINSLAQQNYQIANEQKI